ncbi:MAG: hypothetical protein AB3A66_11680 [Nodularia sp. CChRGM 3473]
MLQVGKAAQRTGSTLREAAAASTTLSTQEGTQHYSISGFRG